MRRLLQGNVRVLDDLYNKFNEEERQKHKAKFDSSTSLQTIMDDMFLVEELKATGSELNDFFTTEKLNQLMDYLLKDMEFATRAQSDKAFKYPLLASDFLTINNKQIQTFFETRSESGQLVNFNRLFGDILSPQGNIRGDMINLTRASYVQKIIVHLYRQNPQLYLEEIFNNQNQYKALFKHSYSKSIAQILQILITKLPANKNEDSQVDIEALIKFNEFRKKLLSEIFVSFVVTAQKKQLKNIHENLYQILINIIQENLYQAPCDQMKTEKSFLDNLISYQIQQPDILIENNRLINLINIILKKHLAAEGEFQLDSNDIRRIFTTSVKFIQDSLAQQKDAKINTFTNQKEYWSVSVNYTPWIENLMILNDKMLQEEVDMYKSLDIQGFIFRLFQEFPMNSLLHVQVSQYLQKILSSGNKDLISVFFTNNLKFELLLKNINKIYQRNLTETGPKETIGYFEFIYQFFEQLLNTQGRKNLQSKGFQEYYQEVFLKIQEKLNLEHSEIDAKQETEDQEYNHYEFDIESVKQKMKHFLNDESKLILENAKSPLKNNRKKSDQKIDLLNEFDIKKELWEEINLVFDEQENAFEDQTYWKSIHYFDLDQLLKELDPT